MQRRRSQLVVEQDNYKTKTLHCAAVNALIFPMHEAFVYFGAGYGHVFSPVNGCWKCNTEKWEKLKVLNRVAIDMQCNICCLC